MFIGVIFGSEKVLFLFISKVFVSRWIVYAIFLLPGKAE